MSAPRREPTRGPLVVSVNVACPAAIAGANQQAVSAIGKHPVTEAVAAAGVNLVGDEQADRRVHGGPDKAVYAYACEDYRWWSRELGRPLSAACFGENLTTTGLDLAAAVVGQRWGIGSVVLEVAGPRVPCYKLGIRMDDAAFPHRFLHAGRAGVYLRILAEGVLQAGDRIEASPPPGHGVSVGEIIRIYAHERHRAARLLAADALSVHWQDWARRRLARHPEDHPAPLQ